MTRRLAWLSFALCAFVVVFIAVVTTRAWPLATQELIRERSPLTWLQSVLLAASAVVAAVIGLRAREPKPFVVLAAGLLVLALDERFMGHEGLKGFILSHGFDYDRARMGVWGDLPLLAVPLVGGWVLWRLQRVVAARLPRALVVAAFGITLAAIAVDIATLHPIGQLVEELGEAVAETLFLVALLAVSEAPP